MKKIILLTLVGFLGTGLIAQRSIDWGIDQVIAPTQIKHQTAVDIHYVAKNNGADTAEIGDSLYSVYTINNQLQTTRVTLLTKRLYPNDTVHVKDNLNALNVNNPSFNGPFRIITSLQNQPGLSLETNATAANNIQTVTIPYIGSGGFGVSVTSLDASKFSVYPNPTTDVINFNVPVSYENNIAASITDITGKTVLSQNFNFNDALKMDVSSLSNGVYILNVVSGGLTHQTKITIAK